MSHWGKSKVVVIVRLHFLDICFTKNEYFLKNSRYTIFQKNKAKNRIKSLRNVKEAKDLTRLPIEETMLMRATLYQDKSQKESSHFQEKSRNVVIRQLSKLRSGEAVYRDIGSIEIKLNEVIGNGKTKDYELNLRDPEKKAEAVIRVSIEWDYYDNVVKEGQLPLKKKCFGLCKPDPTEVGGDPKVSSEFFQQLRLRFDPGQSQEEDEDLAGIPLNASVYGALDQSYSDLLAPHRRREAVEDPGQSTESLLADLDITQVASHEENDYSPTHEQQKQSLAGRGPRNEQSSNSSLNGSETGSQLSLNRRSYAPVLSWTDPNQRSSTQSQPLSPAALDPSSRKSSFENRALPAIPSEKSMGDIFGSDRHDHSSSQTSLKKPLTLTTATSSQWQAVTDTEEDFEAEVAAKEKRRQSRMIAKKLKALARPSNKYSHPSHSAHATITSRAEAKVLFLGSDDEATEGKDTDECDDDFSDQSSPSRVPAEETGPLTRSASEVDMSLPTLPHEGEEDLDLAGLRTSAASNSSLIQRVLSQQSRYHAEDPNLSFRLSTSSNTRASESARSSLRYHRFPAAASDLEETSSLGSNLRHGSQRYSNGSSLLHAQNRQSTHLHYSAVYQRGKKTGEQAHSSVRYYTNQNPASRRGTAPSRNSDPEMIQTRPAAVFGDLPSQTPNVYSEDGIDLEFSNDLEEIPAL